MDIITVSGTGWHKFWLAFNEQPTHTYGPCTAAEAIRNVQESARVDLLTARRVVTEAALTGMATIEFDAPPLADVIPGFVPAGFPVYAIGPGGVGMTTLLTDWIARVTTGAEMPNVQETPEGSVIVAMPEYPPAIMAERARAAGADLGKVHFLSGDFSIPEGLLYLRRKIAETGARLVVIDPLGAVVDTALYQMSSPGPDAHREIRQQITDSLAELAAVQKIGLIVAHSIPRSMSTEDGLADVPSKSS